MSRAKVVTTNHKELDTEDSEKMLGAQVPAKLFWIFKTVAAARKENMKEAIANAARLYIDVDKEASKDGQE